ncbi:MAG: hypothetical protein HYU56_04555 [Candidatus Aenigmarchaeota archaeon]|nr:hypothetical protein [Candidatus Aenigmarchaeota archaeon]
MNARKLWNDYKTPLAIGAGALGTWALGATVEPELVKSLGDNAYNWRFLSSVPLALAGAEASKTYWQNSVGRGLTAGEKALAYLSGAVLASTVTEGWEHLGAKIGPIQEGLKNVGDALGTDIIGKKEFPGQGSAVDTVISTLGAGAVEGIKEYFSKRRKN